MKGMKPRNTFRHRAYSRRALDKTLYNVRTLRLQDADERDALLYPEWGLVDRQGSQDR